MTRSIDDTADIQGKGRDARKIPFAPAAEQPAPKKTEDGAGAKADGHKFCRYSDGSEAAMVRGLQFKSK